MRVIIKQRLAVRTAGCKAASTRPQALSGPDDLPERVGGLTPKGPRSRALTGEWMTEIEAEGGGQAATTAQTSASLFRNDKIERVPVVVTVALTRPRGEEGQ